MSSIFLVILPNSIGVENPFLVKPISKLVQRLVEHGIWSALESAANHLSTLDKNRQWNETIVDEELTQSPEFALWLLIVGWAIGLIVFLVEVFLGRDNIVRSEYRGWV